MCSVTVQALVAAANGVVSSIADKIGPIHINPAEQGLLETIWLLLTSIVCVPAVCKFIPGGSPVLGYLVRPGAGGSRTASATQHQHPVLDVACSNVNSSQHLLTASCITVMHELGSGCLRN